MAPEGASPSKTRWRHSLFCRPDIDIGLLRRSTALNGEFALHGALRRGVRPRERPAHDAPVTSLFYAAACCSVPGGARSCLGSRQSADPSLFDGGSRLQGAAGTPRARVAPARRRAPRARALAPRAGLLKTFTEPARPREAARHCRRRRRLLGSRPGESDLQFFAALLQHSRRVRRASLGALESWHRCPSRGGGYGTGCFRGSRTAASESARPSRRRLYSRTHVQLERLAERQQRFIFRMVS